MDYKFEPLCNFWVLMSL